MSWWRRSPSTCEVETPENTALQHYYKLQENIDVLLGCAEQGQVSQNDLTERLRAMKDNADGINQFLRKQIDTRYFNQRNPRHSMLALDVLHIPELLELTLQFLDTIDILNVSATCKAFKDIIDASPKLKINLLLKPQQDFDIKTDHFYSPFHRGEAPCFEVYSVNDDWDDIPTNHRPIEDTDIIAQITFPADGTGLPNIGSNWKEKFICQPPLTRMSIRQDRECFLHGYGHQEAVYNKDGLTVGDLFQKAISLQTTGCIRCVAARGNGNNDNAEARTEEARNLEKGCKLNWVEFEASAPHCFIGDESETDCE